MGDIRRIKTTHASALSIDDMRHLVKWCDAQTESLWNTAGVTLTHILALYHAAQDADYPGVDEWYSEQPNEAQAAYTRIVHGVGI